MMTGTTMIAAMLGIGTGLAGAGREAGPLPGPTRAIAVVITCQRDSVGLVRMGPPSFTDTRIDVAAGRHVGRITLE